jgi:hypothetical protein
MESGTADRIAATGKTAGLKLLKTCASSMAIIFLFYCQSSAAEKSKGSQIELLSASQMNKIPLMVHVYGIGEKESETLKQEIETIIKKAGRAVISDCCAEDYYNEFLFHREREFFLLAAGDSPIVGMNGLRFQLEIFVLLL